MSLKEYQSWKESTIRYPKTNTRRQSTGETEISLNKTANGKFFDTQLFLKQNQTSYLDKSVIQVNQTVLSQSKRGQSDYVYSLLMDAKDDFGRTQQFKHEFTSLRPSFSQISPRKEFKTLQSSTLSFQNAKPMTGVSF